MKMSTELRGSRCRKGCEKARLYRKKARREIFGLIARDIGFDTGNRIQIASKLKGKRGNAKCRKKLAVESYPNYFFGKITEKFGRKTVLEEIGNECFFVFGKFFCGFQYVGRKWQSERRC